jgi:autotransporter-associated beta strand protein
LAGGAVLVENAGLLSGSGTIGGTVQVNSGGHVAPGTSPGIMSTGSVTLSSSSHLDVEIDDAAVGTQYDQLNVSGTVALGGANLNITLGYTPANGDSFTIVNNDGADAVSGTFAGLAEGSTLAVNGRDLRITYAGGDGNDVVLTVLPVTRTWDGGGSTNNWSEAANWVGDVAPQPGEKLVFTGTVRQSNTNNFPADTSFTSLEFAVHGFSVSGNRLALDSAGGLTVSVASGAATWFSIPLAGSGDLIKTGSGQFIVQAANTYLGATTINAGSINLSAAGTLGDSSGDTVVHGGATLSILTTTPVLDDITVSGTGFTGFGAINGTNGALLAGNVLLAGTTRIGKFNTVSPFTISGAISDGGAGFGLEFTGSEVGRTIVLSGANSYSGPTTLLDPLTLRLGAANAIPDMSAVSVPTGAVLDINNLSETLGSLSGGGGVSLGSGILTTGGNGTSTTFSGTIDGSGGLVKSGSGTWTLSGANTYSGATAVNAGVLAISHASALGASAGGTAVASGATLQISNNIAVSAEPLTIQGPGAGGTGALYSSGGYNTWGGPLALGADATVAHAAEAFTLSGTIDSAGHELTYDTRSSNQVATLSGVISGNGGLRIKGTGQVDLSGANTYSGTTTVQQGALSLQPGAGTLGSGTAGTVVMSGASLFLHKSTAENLTVAGNGKVFAGPVQRRRVVRRHHAVRQFPNLCLWHRRRSAERSDRRRRSGLWARLPDRHVVAADGLVRRQCVHGGHDRQQRPATGERFAGRRSRGSGRGCRQRSRPGRLRHDRRHGPSQQRRPRRPRHQPRRHERRLGHVQQRLLSRRRDRRRRRRHAVRSTARLRRGYHRGQRDIGCFRVRRFRSERRSGLHDHHQ